MNRAFIIVTLAAASANAQTGSFVATLGRDTVHLEHFSRNGNVLDGVIVTRVPETRIVKYQMTYREGGGLARYEFRTTDANGTPLEYTPDSDFVSIPLQRVALPSPVERLTVGVVDNNFRIAWGDAAWVAPIGRSPYRSEGPAFRRVIGIL